MLTKTRVALAVMLAVCVVPGGMARPRTHHTYTTHSRETHPDGSAYPLWRRLPMVWKSGIYNHRSDQPVLSGLAVRH